MDLIAVTLNTPSQTDWTEHIQMFEYVFDHYDYQVIVPDGTIDKITKKSIKNMHISHMNMSIRLTRMKRSRFTFITVL